MKNYTQNKKGQSLVEVTVALSILAIVLTGVVTLAVNATGLMIASRFRMEGTAYAQAGLEEVKGLRSNACDGLAKSFPPVTKTIGGIDYKKTVTIADSSIYTGAKLVTVKVTWTERGMPVGSSKIELKQIMSGS